MNKNLIASVAFGLSIFLFLVLVIPQYDGIRGTNAAIGERELILLERTAAIERVRSLDRQVTERQADINKIVVFLPEDKQIDQILSSIEQVSQQSGLQLVTITSSDATSTVVGQYRSLFVSMDVEGQYSNFVNFLDGLESNLRLYDISEINAAESTAGGAIPGTLSITVNLNAYYLK